MFTEFYFRSSRMRACIISKRYSSGRLIQPSTYTRNVPHTPIYTCFYDCQVTKMFCGNQYLLLLLTEFPVLVFFVFLDLAV